MNADKRAELLLDHHKDTFQTILYHWKIRNRLFVYILILLALIALDTYSPGSFCNLVNAYIAKKLGSPAQSAPVLDLAVIGSAVWFLLLCLVIEYYKRSIHVDRQYNYIDSLEQQICEVMGGNFVTREGRAYYSKKGVSGPEQREDERPLYLRAVGPLYIYVFPVILTLLVLWKLGKEDWPPKEALDFFNLVIGLVIILYNGFYLIWAVSRKTAPGRDKTNLSKEPTD